MRSFTKLIDDDGNDQIEEGEDCRCNDRGGKLTAAEKDEDEKTEDVTSRVKADGGDARDAVDLKKGTAKRHHKGEEEDQEKPIGVYDFDRIAF